MSNPTFDSVNPHFKSKYASLAAVRNAIIPSLSKNGLCVMQHLTSTENGVRCGVLLSHESGEWLEFEPMDVPATKPDAQGFMSAATYAKRGTLQAIACVVGDGDDDGNEASKTEEKKEEKKPDAKPADQLPKTGKISAGQTKYLQMLFRNAGYKEDSDKHSYTSSVLNRPVESITDITTKEAHAVIETLQKLLGTTPA